MLAVNRQNLGSTILFFIVVSNIAGWRPFKLTITYLLWESFGNLTRMNASLSSTGAVSVFVDVLNNVNHPFAYAEVYADSGKGQYDFEILNRTIDFCKFSRTKSYEPLLQIFYKIILESGPWPKACPIRKSRYSIENLLIDANKLPPYMPERNGYVTLKFKNKEKGVMEDISTLTVFFAIKNAAINRLKTVTKKLH